MLSEIVLINRKSSQNETLKLSDTWLMWNTCVRQMAFGTIHWLDEAYTQGLIKETDQIYVGAEAYRYCLEVVCGLHSPMLGETEVGGQFKLAFAQRPLTDLQKAVGFHKFFQSIFTDFKEVRSQFLLNLGSSSYGSLTRKYLANSDCIHVMGAGHLAEEMLPWLSKNRKEVVVYSRRLEQAKSLQTKFTSIKAQKYNQPVQASDDATILLRGAVIVAAPISAKEIAQWITLHDHGVKMIIDLRANAHQDLMENSPGVVVIRLDQLFKEVEQVQQEVLTKVQSARDYIAKISQSRVLTMDHRPHGWDDLCA